MKNTGKDAGNTFLGQLDGRLSGAKRLWPCLIVFAAGVALMLIGGLVGGGNNGSSPTALNELITKDGGGGADAADVTVGAVGAVGADGYGDRLEKKLADALSSVQGAGKVQVIITFTEGGGLELAKDASYEISETFGGTGAANGEGVSGKTDKTDTSQKTEKRETKHVLVTADNGRTEPIVIKSASPRAEGAVIVAEGGGDAEIKAALTRAAGALLNLPAHKIEVLKMRK